MTEEYPQISTDGSLLLAWQLNKSEVLLVGGGNVAADRIRSLLAGFNSKTRYPHITLVCPTSGLNDECKYRLYDPEQVELYGIKHIDRNFDQDLDLPSSSDKLPDLVLTATDDAKLSEHVHSICKKLRIVVNVADVPPLCDFYFGSVIKRGPLQILVSTNGKGPRIANRIRRKIESSLPSNIAASIENVGLLRSQLREIAPDQDQSPRRMEFMKRVSDKWSLGELSIMTPEMRTKVLEGWEDDVALGFADVTGEWWRRVRCPVAEKGADPHMASLWVGVAGVCLGVAGSAMFSWIRSSR